MQGIIQVAHHRPDPLREVFGEGGVGSSLVANAAVVDLLALVANAAVGDLLALVAKAVRCRLPHLAAPLVRDVAAPLGWPAGGVQVRRLGHGGLWPLI